MGRVFKYGKEANSLRIRLFNRNCGSVDDSMIHEKIHVNGTIGKLKNSMLHYSYRDTKHYFEKFNYYSTISAIIGVENHKKINQLSILLKLFFSFFIYYFVWRNFLNGFPGFVWSAYNSFYGFVK